jgi:hypothetical protein
VIHDPTLIVRKFPRKNTRKDNSFPKHLIEGDIANYPHICFKVEAMWGSTECVAYLKQLMVNDDKIRQGFSFSVFTQLTALYEYHNKAFPEFNKDSNLKWTI